MSPVERSATDAMRRALTSREPQQAADMLLDGLRKTSTNAEFLAQLTRSVRP